MRIYVSLLILSLLLLGGCTIGEAFRLPSNFADDSDDITVTLVSFDDNAQTISISVSGHSHLLSRIYYSLDGDDWEVTDLTKGANVVPGDQEYTITIPAPSVENAGILVYACNRINSAWECNNQRWQKGSLPITPQTSFGVDSLASCSDNIQNQGEEDVDCGGPCVRCGTCGDRTVDSVEECDDGNLQVLDGCDDNCQIESFNAPCAKGTTLCSNGECSYDCANAGLGSNCNDDSICGPGEGCDCADCAASAGSCQSGLVCGGRLELCCDSGTDGVCDSQCADVDSDCTQAAPSGEFGGSCCTNPSYVTCEDREFDIDLCKFDLETTSINENYYQETACSDLSECDTGWCIYETSCGQNEYRTVCESRGGIFVDQVEEPAGCTQGCCKWQGDAFDSPVCYVVTETHCENLNENVDFEIPATYNFVNFVPRYDTEVACANICFNTCGDNFQNDYEECDDGNTISGDGCSSICHKEFNSVCTLSEPSSCNINYLVGLQTKTSDHPFHRLGGHLALSLNGQQGIDINVTSLDRLYFNVEFPYDFIDHHLFYISTSSRGAGDGAISVQGSRVVFMSPPEGQEIISDLYSLIRPSEYHNSDLINMNINGSYYGLENFIDDGSTRIRFITTSILPTKLPDFVRSLGNNSISLVAIFPHPDRFDWGIIREYNSLDDMDSNSFVQSNYSSYAQLIEKMYGGTLLGGPTRSGRVTVNIPSNMPQVLYYQSAINSYLNSYMGGRIIINDSELYPTIDRTIPVMDFVRFESPLNDPQNIRGEWSATDFESGISGYEVSFWKWNLDEDEKIVEDLFTTQETLTIPATLIDGERYYFYVSAINGAGHISFGYKSNVLRAELN